MVPQQCRLWRDILSDVLTGTAAIESVVSPWIHFTKLDVATRATKATTLLDVSKSDLEAQ